MRSRICRRGMARGALFICGLASYELASADRASGQSPVAPETITFANGPLKLRALLWRPAGPGPFAAVLFNHGSYTAAESARVSDPAVLGPIFARHGYVLLLPFRQGIGLSRGQGRADGDQMSSALDSGGVPARNRVQLALIEGEELDEARVALAILREQRAVDRRRIAVIGHSFGGSLTVFMAARDTSIRAAVVFSGAAGSWRQSPELRQRLMAAVGRARAAILFIHPANDYSLESGKALAAELDRLRRPFELTIYPAFGASPHEGHNFLFRSTATWESDLFNFLAAHLPPR